MSIGVGNYVIKSGNAIIISKTDKGFYCPIVDYRNRDAGNKTRKQDYAIYHSSITMALIDFAAQTQLTAAMSLKSAKPAGLRSLCKMRDGESFTYLFPRLSILLRGGS